MNRIVPMLLWGLLLLVASATTGAESRWVTSDGQAQLASVTAAEAIQMALAEARRKAVEEMAGVQLSSATIVQDFAVLSD